MKAKGIDTFDIVLFVMFRKIKPKACKRHKGFQGGLHCCFNNESLKKCYHRKA